jgi:hypothetical protein
MILPPQGPEFMKKTLSMFDQMLFNLACGHAVVLGRLHDVNSWACEECRMVTNLRVEPHRSRLAQEWDTADQLDKQARERGEDIVRADK